jgi:uncharacterized protein (UPF0218 family)
MPQPSPAALARAEALWQELRPQVATALEKMSPAQVGLTFDEIEAQSASVGDLIARVLMHEAVSRQAAVSEAEVERAKQAALSEAGSLAGKLRAAALKVKRVRDKPCTLATVRGPVPLEREYLYFPELNTGVFPPRCTP